MTQFVNKVARVKVLDAETQDKMSNDFIFFTRLRQTQALVNFIDGGRHMLIT